MVCFYSFNNIWIFQKSRLCYLRNDLSPTRYFSTVIKSRKKDGKVQAMCTADRADHEMAVVLTLPCVASVAANSSRRRPVGGDMVKNILEWEFEGYGKDLGEL